jgi:hypothetical protein
MYFDGDRARLPNGTGLSAPAQADRDTISDSLIKTVNTREH